MKQTTPTTPPIRQDGKPDPKWLTWIYAIGTVALILMLSYIISKTT